MANPLYNDLNNNNIVSQLFNYARNFKGDPRSQVQELLNSGRMTQAQYNQLQGPAQQLYNLICGRK